MRRIIVVPALAAALVAGGIAPAAAAPPEQEIIPLVCDNGDSFDIAVNGHGSFTPGRIVGSTGVLVPVAFGDFVFRTELPDGTVVEETSDEGESKGGGNVAERNPRPTVTCSFSLSMTLTEPDPETELPAGTELTFSGTVTGFLVGR